MNQVIHYVGLDVHKETIAVSIARASGHCSYSLSMNRSAGLRPGTNLRSATNAPGRRPALRSRFRGSKREIPFGRILTQALSSLGGGE
jgi:hypothetical protein